ncbi:hypothetical protein [Archangium lansingense]|uniref:Beta-ketoacyl synthase N-terminal domain-containing protein n=1 Tax=Archangium lansingense TaxID=2995310 RepID=A0ABT4AKY1_9BACT|nr:hypothetical protein [Archangium lansinium]MCY1082300.1 hypothetical protein [Archangium lansinium]
MSGTRMQSWVRAMGMASALGPLVPGCAAFRARLTRSTPAPEFETFFPGDERPGTVAVFAAGAATYGFSGVGRLVALLVETLVDLGSREELEQLNPGTGLYLALPDPETRGFTTGKEPSDEDPPDAARRVALLAERVVRGAWDALRLPGWKGPLRSFHGGNAAFAQALAAAEEDLRTRQTQAGLVCAVDSLVSTRTLELLNAEGQLKTAARPVGLMAGEAGVALLLVRPPPASTETPEPRVLVRDVVLGMEPNLPGTGRPSDGRAITQFALAALGRLLPGEPLPVLVLDHDGRPYRGHEWGMLLLHLSTLDPRFRDCRTWLPADGFGATGAASGGVGTAVALQALQRGYSRTPSLLVLSSSDTGERAAIHLAVAPSRAG